MRKIFCFFCFLCCLVCGAQEIKPREATFDDYLSLLNEVGYNTYSYQKGIRGLFSIILYHKTKVK